MAVCPAQRRRGVGRALLDACEELVLAGLGPAAGALHLQVECGNAAALAMYAGRGYRVVREQPNGRVLLAKDFLGAPAAASPAPAAQ